MTQNPPNPDSTGPSSGSSAPPSPGGSVHSHASSGNGSRASPSTSGTPGDPDGNTDPTSPTAGTGGSTTPTTNTGSSTPNPSTAPKPPAANMGSFEWDGTQWLIRMGEVPNVSWTKAKPAKVKSPFQLRGSPKTDGYKPLLERRGKGYSPPKIKVTKKCVLPIMNEKIKQHVKDHGMFSITCLPDPRDPKYKMVSVLDHTSLFSVAKANELAKNNKNNKWDTYDICNDNDARMLLESITDINLWNELKGRDFL